MDRHSNSISRARGATLLRASDLLQTQENNNKTTEDTNELHWNEFSVAVEFLLSFFGYTTQSLLYRSNQISSLSDSVSSQTTRNSFGNASFTSTNQIQQEFEANLQLFFHGCDAIFGNKETFFLFPQKKQYFKIVNLRPMLFKKIRYLDKIITILGALIEIEISGKGVTVNIIDTIECLYNLYFCDLSICRDCKPTIYQEISPLLQELIGMTSTRDIVKLKIYEIIEDLEELVKKSQETLEKEEDAFVFIVKMLTQDKTQQYVLLQKITKLEEQHPININLLQPFDDCLTAFVLSKLLDFIQFERELYLSSSFLPKISELTDYWKESHHKVETVCSLIELCRASTANNGLETTFHLLDDVVPKIIVLISQLDLEMQSDYINRITNTCIQLLALACEKDYNIDFFVNAVIPKITSIALDYHSQDFSLFYEKEQVMKCSLDFVEAALRVDNSAELLSQGYASITTFFERIKVFAFSKDYEIMVKLLELGTLIIRQSSSAFNFNSSAPSNVPPKVRKMLQSGDLTDFFANILPITLFEINGWSSSQDQRRDAVRKIVEFGYESISRGLDKITVFTFYLPSIYRRISRKDELINNQKMEIMVYLLELSLKKMESGCNISALLSDGFPLVLSVCDSFDSIKECSIVAADKFYIVTSGYSVLTELNSVFGYIKNHFDIKSASTLIRNLIANGKRHDVKMINQICDAEFLSSRYDNLREFLFHEGSLNGREFSGLCKILVLALKLNSTHRSRDLIQRITQSILNQLDLDLKNKQLTKKQIDQYMDNLSRIALFKAMFADELDGLKDRSISELSTIFYSKFPQEILSDSKILEVLNSVAVRVEHMKHQYTHVEKLAVKCLNELFTVDVPNTSNNKTAFRIEHVNRFVYEFPRNEKIRNHLVNVGYHPDLWKEDPMIVVEVEGNQNIEENLRLAILGVFGEYVDILKELNLDKVTMTTTSTNGETEEIVKEEIEIETLFTENMSIDQLKSRRIVVQRVIDDYIKQLEDKPELQQQLSKRKLSLFVKESQLEAESDQQRRKQRQFASKRKFFARLNNSFFNCISTCSSNIVGCYAPDGEHCEKPVEIAVKAISAVVSIYDQHQNGTIGMEIENCEVLYTDQGMLVFKAYSSGHPYDTSLVWLSLFKALLESHRVPAIIIPNQFPTPSTFSSINSLIAAEYCGTLITFMDDFFEGTQTYYDSKPEKVKEGDIILTDLNIHLLQIPTSQLRRLEWRKRSGSLLTDSTELSVLQSVEKKTFSPQRDLAGSIVANVLRDLLMKGILDTAQADAFGKFVYKFTNKLIEKGFEDESVLVVGFDLQKWNRSKSKEEMTHSQKREIINSIIQEVRNEIIRYYDTPPNKLYADNKRHFFELKNHLEVISSTTNCLSLHLHLLNAIKFVLKSKQVLLSILEFANQSAQEDIMRFIFLNEERIWTPRGGRSRQENIDQFLNFLPDAQGDDRSRKFPGVVLLSERPEEKYGAYIFKPEQVIGYCIGEFVSNNIYEIVTAWVDSKYKGMNNSIQMYFDIMERVHELGAKTVIFDVMKGTPERIINASPPLKMVHKFGVDKWFINKRHDSYTKETISGKKEVYEKLSIRVMPLVQSLRLYSKFAVVGNIFRDKAPKLLTHKSPLKSNNLKPSPSSSRVKFTIPQNIHVESTLQSTSWWVTAGFAIALGNIIQCGQINSNTIIDEVVIIDWIPPRQISIALDCGDGERNITVCASRNKLCGTITTSMAINGVDAFRIQYPRRSTIAPLLVLPSLSNATIVRLAPNKTIGLNCYQECSQDDAIYNCLSKQNCYECTKDSENTKCGWCGNVCWRGNEVSALSRISCPNWIWNDWQKCCSNFTSNGCEFCNQQFGCGWCRDVNNHCTPGNSSNGPFSPTELCVQFQPTSQLCGLIIPPLQNKNISNLSTLTSSFKSSAYIRKNMFCFAGNQTNCTKFLTAVDLGATIPGFQPGNINMFEKNNTRIIQYFLKYAYKLGVDAIRLYTLWPPSFYEALVDFNTNRKRPLYILQGIYPPETSLLTSDGIGIDAFSTISSVKREIEYAVNATQGNYSVPIRSGYSSGYYKYNVSPYIIGFIFGYQWNISTINMTNKANIGRSPSENVYIRALQSSSPFEQWISDMLNHIASSLSNQGWQIPVAVDNYAEFDPFNHPLEPEPEKNDKETIDSGHLFATPYWSAGYFISIAANPYFPRFLALEYQNCFDCANTPDPFMGYIKQLRDYYPNSALIISEVGISTSLIPSYTSSFFYNGVERTRNLGGYSEPDAGEVLANIIYKIFQERVCGIIIHELVDEWFKEDWNTKSLEKQSSDQYWKNILDAGENRGLISIDPFQSEETSIILDGGDKDWTSNNSNTLIWFSSSDISIRFTYDEAFFYMGLTKSNNKTWKFDSGKERLFIAFDTMPGGAKSGISLLPVDLLFSDGPEFIADIFNSSSSFMYSNSNYDIFTWENRFALSLGNNYFFNDTFFKIFTKSSIQSEKEYTKGCGDVNGPNYQVFQLIHGNTIPGDPDFQNLCNWYFKNTSSVLEIRIPWGMLGFYDPSFRQVWDYISNKRKINGITTSGINVTFLHIDFGFTNIYSNKTTKFSWPQWGIYQDIVRGWHFREKNGLFSSIQNILNNLKNSNWQICDRPANFTCQQTNNFNCAYWAYGSPKFECGINCLIGVIGALTVVTIIIIGGLLIVLKKRMRSKSNVIHREENYVSINFNVKEMLAKREQRTTKRKNFFSLK